MKPHIDILSVQASLKAGSPDGSLMGLGDRQAQREEKIKKEVDVRLWEGAGRERERERTSIWDSELYICSVFSLKMMAVLPTS